MQLYIDLVNTILEKGKRKSSGRDIEDTISYFGWFGKIDLQEEFPLLTTKQMPFKLIARELQWFLSGNKSIEGYDLKFWEPWADENGNVPSAYGHYWRSFPNTNFDNYDGDGPIPPVIDQLGAVIDMLKYNPYTRRAVISAWDPRNALWSKLPPCHYTFVFNYDGERLNLHLTQRSGDVPVGIPFNWASYSLLLHLVAHEVRMEVGTFAHTIVDAHIYLNQLDLIKEQITREPKTLPTIKLSDKKGLGINTFTQNDVELIGYNSWPSIKFPVEI